MDAFVLSRIQFAANITFHILFPSITIGLGWLLLYFKFRFQRSKDEKWMELYFLFTKIFALTFSLGVVSGVTMSFQFGTNWPGYMNTVGNIAGPLLAYEVLTAFFLEASMLGIMLFGFRRVKPWVHSLATFLVAAGTSLSAFWILALNSWMHTPTGFEMIDGVAHATSWKEVIFNPSMPYRFAHAVLASGLTVAFLGAGLMAYKRLRGDSGAAVQAGLRSCLFLAAVLAPLQLVVGDLHGTNTRDYQPQKLAAMEALWESGEGVHLSLFALPDEAERENRFEVSVPKLGSLIVTRDPNGYVQGLNDFEGEHPPVAPVYWSFRIMVGTGMLMIFAGLYGAWSLWKRGELPTWFLRLLQWMTLAGWVATVAGWYVTEIGRQPWLVQGVLKAKDAVADIPPANVGVTLAAYLLTYAVLLVAYVTALFYLTRNAKRAGDVNRKPNPQ
ncbi:cytochrome ubiquinol oxidase subunit I [Pelagicoccus sp. NFK12]|uniref:Cytochrome ubiquinol oxidase subunit I n=1 Tax=Pelagicoccus enzymogenes TaxID=2773457 RepID=A0A927F7A2_9BACT|nr:cytochrome ubiquinol oxidase subunit I [Pelagicoccus enzymogenes]MBD5779557.1 cytochrome ubiquinol oxidase subunit I [Pelagicoccus enzymogenes]MDQ8200348.1 cytochrome ubiquinol oxidase subunit I [Pelagicoccus enzymogenes]